MSLDPNALHSKACGCARCVVAASVPDDLLDGILSRAAGGARVTVVRERGGSVRTGLVLDGATDVLARRCGFKHARGPCYFTGPKIMWLVAQAVAS